MQVKLFAVLFFWLKIELIVAFFAGKSSLSAVQCSLYPKNKSYFTPIRQNSFQETQKNQPNDCLLSY